MLATASMVSGARLRRNTLNTLTNNYVMDFVSTPKKWIINWIMAEVGLEIKIFDKINLWHKPDDIPNKAGDIFYKSGWDDYRIEYFDAKPGHKKVWQDFIESENPKKWCYITDLIDIIDNDEFKTGDAYVINHI